MTADIRRAIFLQTGFRSGGTWLWSRFRANPTVLGYCEHLNEALLGLTPEISDGLRAQTSGLNHPTMDDPYFEEFLPLIGPTGTGVRGYRAEFGIGSYFRQDASIAEALHAYIASLLDQAEREGKQPVLKFTRALGRAAWLRMAFPKAIQILLQRAPAAQFASGYRQATARDNVTFLMIPLWGLTQLDDPLIRRLLDELSVDILPSDADLPALATAYAAAARRLSLRQSAAVFITFYTVNHALSAPSADIEIEIERLHGDATYAASVSRFLCDHAGVAVDLSTISSDEERRGGDQGVGLDRETFLSAAHETLDMLEGRYPFAVAYTRRRLRA